MSHPRGPYSHHLMVRVDKGADVNCMNEITFNELFPEVKLSVCPNEIQNFRNFRISDISILEQFFAYLQFRGEKYENMKTFRMGVLLPNYPQDMVVKGQNMPHFSKMSGDQMRAPTSQTNVFQILGDMQKQQAVHSQSKNPEPCLASRTTTPLQNTKAMTEMATGIQENNSAVHVHTFLVKTTSWSGPQAPGAHVCKLPQQVLKPGELVALQKVKHAHNSRTSVTRLPLTKQQILSHYSSCFEGIG